MDAPEHGYGASFNTRQSAARDVRSATGQQNSRTASGPQADIDGADFSWGELRAYVIITERPARWLSPRPNLSESR
jgi:hypothetical protein